MSTKIQSTFIGYGGKPCTIFSLLDSETNILVVSAEGEYRKARRDDHIVVITNDKGIPRDRLFADDDIKDAINAFYSLKNGIAEDGRSSRLTFSERAQRANPESSIEKDGIDQSGPRYRIAENITCTQMATLATCLHAMKSSSIESALDMADELTRLLSGEVVTI